MSESLHVSAGGNATAAGRALVPWRAVGVACAVVTVLGIHAVGRVGAYCSPIHTDSFAYAAYAYRIAHGEVLYRDMQVDKPPGLLWLNAVVYLVGPAARWPTIPLETLFMLGGYVAAYKTGRELYGRGVGLVLMVAAALAINVFLVTDFTVEGFNLAESYMVLTSATAMLYYLRGCDTCRMRPLVLAGVFLGAGLLLKQTALPLILAVLLHRTLFGVILARRAREWLRAGGALLAGVGAVLVPVGVVLAAQGVFMRALESATVDASALLQRETGWPDRWSHVLPLWVPLAWCAVGLVGWITAVWRTRNAPARSTADTPALPSVAGVSFLLVWVALECVSLACLPRRSFHYYALSCLPVIFLSGVMWAMLLRERAATGTSSTNAVLAAVAFWSFAFARPAVDVLVPTAIARYRTYDSKAERSAFEDALKLDDIGIGNPNDAT